MLYCKVQQEINEIIDPPKNSKKNIKNQTKTATDTLIRRINTAIEEIIEDASY
jgi:hypothetical protein